jgi:hypothetical protein
MKPDIIGKPTNPDCPVCEQPTHGNGLRHLLRGGTIQSVFFSPKLTDEVTVERYLRHRKAIRAHDANAYTGWSAMPDDDTEAGSDSQDRYRDISPAAEAILDLLLKLKLDNPITTLREATGHVLRTYSRADCERQVKEARRDVPYWFEGDGDE